MALAVLLALLTGVAAVSPAAAADSDRLGFSAGAAGGGGGLRQWADEYLNFFSGDGGRTDQRRPSCRGRECPSGMQCCCCGDRCYCKEECSFQPCAEPGLPGR
jgi:hypothetical protein